MRRLTGNYSNAGNVEYWILRNHEEKRVNEKIQDFLVAGDKFQKSLKETFY